MGCYVSMVGKREGTVVEDVGGLGVEAEMGDVKEELDDGVGSPCAMIIGIGRRKEWNVFDECYTL
ncbi:hypothetical protein A2U01_0110857, partial [Trifolium medium]|nr:hypothetical protein [Trifolium medium]